jgi:hypothetical protein
VAIVADALDLRGRLGCLLLDAWNGKYGEDALLEKLDAILAQPEAVSGIDVERLARALSVSLDIYGWDLDSMARDIAAAYEAAGEAGEVA